MIFSKPAIGSKSGVSGLGPNDVNFQIFSLLESPLLPQPIIQPDATYFVVTLSLTHKGNFSKVVHQKSKFLSQIFSEVCQR